MLSFIPLFHYDINCIFIPADFAAKCQENHYGLKGKSTRLSISLRNLTKVVWRRFDRKELLANSDDGVSPDYKNRMKLNISDWSLTINNLQEDDSGLYEALTKWEKESLAAFTLAVESKSCPSIHLHLHT